MIPSHVTVMATMTNTCDLHQTAIESHARALALQLAGIDVVNHLHLAVAIVLCMVNMVRTVVVATMGAVKLAHVAVEMAFVNEVQQLVIASVGAQALTVKNTRCRLLVPNG